MTVGKMAVLKEPSKVVNLAGSTADKMETPRVEWMVERLVDY